MDISTLGERAREAARTLATATTAQKNDALHTMADALVAASEQILGANADDVAAARDAGTAEALLDRLTLTPERLDAMAAGLRDLAQLADPVGQVVRGWTNPNGVQVRQVRVPFGVVGIIYEARPNVTADAAGICVKSGNACLLRGSSSALRSNEQAIAALRAGLEQAGLPADAVQLVDGPRETTKELMTARGAVDLLIPRGGAGLIQTVVENSTVPVIETGTGNCHLYVDADADLDIAVSVLHNAKTQRPSVCNAAETVLVHADIAEDFWAQAAPKLQEAGVVIHGDEPTRRLVPEAVPAAEEDFESEWLSLDLSARVVDDIDAALAHVRRHSTGHSETIITQNVTASHRWTTEVDAAAVLVNASSRFVDGGEFGFGAEIGISTQKLHARGPMGLTEMTSSKYVVVGSGQIR